MRTNYIVTPIHTEKFDDEYFENEFNNDNSWIKRSHKLQERRWRKLASRTPRNDHIAHFRPRHQAF